MNSMLKKSIVLGTIVFMILASVSTTTGTIIKSSNVIEPLGNEPVINITLPDAHLYYHPFKFRYADVEFDNPNEIIDVNLSGVFPGIIELAFSQEIYVHIQNQNTPIKFSYVQGLRNEVETIGGGAETGYIGPDSAWMGNFSISI